MTRDELVEMLDSTACRDVYCVLPIVALLAPLWYVWWLLPQKWIVGIPLAIFSASMIWISTLYALSDPPTAG